MGSIRGSRTGLTRKPQDWQDGIVEFSQYDLQSKETRLHKKVKD